MALETEARERCRTLWDSDWSHRVHLASTAANKIVLSVRTALDQIQQQRLKLVQAERQCQPLSSTHCCDKQLLQKYMLSKTKKFHSHGGYRKPIHRNLPASCVRPASTDFVLSRHTSCLGGYPRKSDCVSFEGLVFSTAQLLILMEALKSRFTNPML